MGKKTSITMIIISFNYYNYLHKNILHTLEFNNNLCAANYGLLMIENK